ncbi:MAG: hypothetical protein HY683_10050 [Chloroflexi bacterium]|nr:hypothetical protein [Chloroflexota bacterium]
MVISVRDCEERLREVVNHPGVQRELIKDTRKWQQICSSMDVIGDTDAAIAAYQQLDSVDDTGSLYLITYGVLQVLVVQQDAVTHAAEAVGFPCSFSDEVRRIRTIRNCAIGHPTKRRSGTSTESFGIIRVSLKHAGFTLYSFDWDGGTPSQDVNLLELIDKQGREMCDALTGIAEHLDTKRRPVGS